MIIFRLPDLGEGLPDAEIREWYISVGDTVKVDQPLVAMETAKALVDVPAPHDGIIEKLYGDVGDTIHTGNPLIGFEGDSDHDETMRKDSGTVVGSIEMSDDIIADDTYGGTTTTEHTASPAVRALARRRGVDLNTLNTQDSRIRSSHVKRAARTHTTAATPEGYKPLSAIRRAMIMSMEKSHHEVVPVNLSDDSDINAWYGTDNITLRMIRAIAAACQAEPVLNGYFDSKAMAIKHNDHVNIGLAVDTPHGLYVPVLRDIINSSDDELRTAIVGAGKLRDDVVAVDGKPVVHKVIPLSLTVDHRAVTGGEAARFLQTLITQLR